MSENQTPSPLLGALRVVLRPVVRLLVARGVTLPLLVPVLKELFVEVAVRDFRLDGRPPSDSRVSLLTGVHRKDVRAIRGEARAAEPRQRPLAATVLGRWLGDPAFADAGGRPLVLPRQAPPGEPSFETLVAGVSTDLRARTVLDELLRLGLVVLEAEGAAVRLVAEAFVPAADEAELLAFWRDNLADHAAAASANLLAAPGARRLLERAVFHGSLRPADLDRIEAEAGTLAQAALRHLNSLAIESRQAGAESPRPSGRFRFGVYFWREDARLPDDDREPPR